MLVERGHSHMLQLKLTFFTVSEDLRKIADKLEKLEKDEIGRLGKSVVVDETYIKAWIDGPWVLLETALDQDRLSRQARKPSLYKKIHISQVLVDRGLGSRIEGKRDRTAGQTRDLAVELGYKYFTTGSIVRTVEGDCDAVCNVDELSYEKLRDEIK